MVGAREKLTDSAEPLIKNMFFAMIFKDRQTIQYAKSNPNIKVERIFGNLIEIKAFEGVYNIIPQLKVAIEKIALNQSSSSVKLSADDIYLQQNMFDKWQVRYIEYLCMRVIELQNKTQQQDVLANYILLVKNLVEGIWVPDDRAEITPEKLLEMSFDKAKVKHRLNNLGDGNRQKRTSKLAYKTPQTLGDRITNWFKNDFKKPYRWEK